MPKFKSISFKMAVLQGGRQNLPSPCVCYPNNPMGNRVKACRSSISPNFSLDQVKQAVGELKLGRSDHPTGMVREILLKCGDGLLYLLVEMVNTIKTSKNLPSDWNKIWIRTLKQKRVLLGN